MSLIDWNYTWTDTAGVQHHYPRLFGWRCSIHDRVCSPFKPVTDEDLLRLAAVDEELDDDTFVAFRQVLEGRAVGGES